MQLTDVLVAKIAITLALWCPPLLFFPPSWFKRLGVPPPEPIVFARLLGAAFLALVVVYSHGWTESRQGKVPAVVVRAGVVSNGLAAVILTGYGVAGYWREWGRWGRVYMWVSAAAGAGITAGLLVGR
ncbi:MAG TPA: hypothetical protein VMZ71_03225 [Gemmataceae bacterium]|nr:hypothetical protein [Gemmataceae bacterium]